MHIGIIVFVGISLNFLMIIGSVLDPVLYIRNDVVIPGTRAFLSAYHLWWLLIELVLIGVCGACMVFIGVKNEGSDR